MTDYDLRLIALSLAAGAVTAGKVSYCDAPMLAMQYLEFLRGGDADEDGDAELVVATHPMPRTKN